MFERSVPLEEDLSIVLDGDRIPARPGEPIAAALLAAGEIRLARSPKLHRPRGPSCMRGDCDGCLMRVDGEPNVMTCLRNVRGGETISTQNVLGTRKTDLLRVTDWFFPNGIDHHHLLAGVPGVSGVLTSFARKMAGLGRLPDRANAPRAARRIDADVLVIGGGVAGLTTAAALAARELRVLLVDDGDQVGGDALLFGEEGTRAVAAIDLTRVTVLAHATAIGVYDDDVLVVARDGTMGAGEDVVATTVVTAPARVFATGSHDGVLAVENNDLPGVFSARAILRLASLGVRPCEPFAVVGEGPCATRVAAMWTDLAVAQWPAGELAAIVGGSAVRGVVSHSGVRASVSGVFTELPTAPAFELAEQAGAALTHLPARGYAVDVDAEGRAGEGVWAVGSCSTSPFTARLANAVADGVARRVLG